MSATRGFPVLLEAFFVDRLLRQRQVSPHTIASYRDTFRLLLQYAQQQLGKAPSKLALSDLDTSFLGAFLDHLEQERGDEPAAPRCRPFRNRPLAWPRIDRDHLHLSAGRHATQRTGAGHDHHVRRQNRPLPPRRSRLSLPEEPLIMPITSRASRWKVLGFCRSPPPHSE
jgi:Phage integrase, N-terminal SAM-like domain